MFQRWLEKESFYRSIPFSIFYSIIALGVSLILLLIDNSWLYGTLFGIAILWLSYFAIWILWFKIPKIKTFMTKIIPIGTIALRILIFVISLLLISLLINPWLLPGIEHKDKLLKPINTLSLLWTYSIPTVSYITIGIIDVVQRKKLYKEE